MNKSEIKKCKDNFKRVCNNEKTIEEAAVYMIQLSSYMTSGQARLNELENQTPFTKLINLFTDGDEKLRNAIVSDNLKFYNTVIQLFKIAWKQIAKLARNNIRLNEKINRYRDEAREDFLKLKEILLFNVEAIGDLEVQKWAENINNSTFTECYNKFENQLFKDVRPYILRLVCVVNAFYRKTQGNFNIKQFSSLENALCNVFRERILEEAINTQYQYQNKAIVRKCFEKLTEGINYDVNLIKQKDFLFEVPHFKTLYYCYVSDKNIYDIGETVEVKALMVDFLQGLQLIDTDYKVSEKYEDALESLQNHEINEAVLLLRKLSPNVDFVDKANALLAIIIHELFDIKSRNHCLEPGLDSDCIDVNIKKLLARGQSYNSNREKRYCRALHDIWYEEKHEDWINDDSQLLSEKVDILDSYVHGLHHKVERDKLPEISKEPLPGGEKLPKDIRKSVKKRRKEENNLFIEWSKKNKTELPLANIMELMDRAEEEYDLNMLAELKYGSLPNYTKIDLPWILSIIN